MGFAGVTDLHLIGVDPDDLLAMRTAALGIDPAPDEENLQAHEGKHQPGAQDGEETGDRGYATSQEQKQKLALAPTETSVGFNDKDSVTTADLHIRSNHKVSPHGCDNRIQLGVVLLIWNRFN